MKRIDGQWLKFGPTTDALIRRSYEEKEVAAVPEAVSDLREGGGGGDLEVSLPQTPGSYYGSPNGNGYHRLSTATTLPLAAFTDDKRRPQHSQYLRKAAHRQAYSIGRGAADAGAIAAALAKWIHDALARAKAVAAAVQGSAQLRERRRDARAAKAAARAPPPLPGGWRCVNTPSGSYYYNTGTRQVSWQPPIEWLRSLERRANGSPEVKA